MPTLRYASTADAALITAHRNQMFRDNNYGTDEALVSMDAAFEPWVTERLRDGRYIGLFLEDSDGVVAAAGIFLGDFPPHWIHAEPFRAYVLNVYTAPEARGKGYAKQLMAAVLEECKRRRLSTVTLHASPQGRGIYEGMGFAATSVMMLTLELEPS